MTGEVEAAHALEAAYDRAWCRGDVDGLLGCLRADVVLVNPFGEVARGHAEAREVFTRILGGWAAGSAHESTVLRVEPVAPGVLVLDGRARVSGLGPQAPGPPVDGVLVHGFTDVLVRTGDGWRVAHVRAYPAHA